MLDTLLIMSLQYTIRTYRNEYHKKYDCCKISSSHDQKTIAKFILD